MEEDTVTEKTDPLAMICTLPAGVRAERRIEIAAMLASRTGFTRHSDGVELQWVYSEETAHTLLEFVLFERQCCNRFSYELGFPPPHESITLRLRAAPEQVEALQAFYCC
jgi:hypothetical protein